LQRQTVPLEALYCHTQEAAVLLGKYMKRIPTILSLDATPINMDSIGHAYGHRTGWGPIERVKHYLTKKSDEEILSTGSPSSDIEPLGQRLAY
jgi:hypothetical protein